jgi:hypothetical protein
MPEHLNRQQRRWEGLKSQNLEESWFKYSQLPSTSLNTRNGTWRCCLNTHLHGGCGGCQVLAYGLHDPLTPYPQSDGDANAPIKRKVQWRLWLLVHRSFCVYQPYCYH